MELLTPENLWLLYLSLVLGPFVQEDVAVVAAAGVAASHPEMSTGVFAAIFIGLLLSDIWKYWIGYYARTHDRARKWAQKPGVAKASLKLTARLGSTLMAVRFIPFTRVPTYVAAGFTAVSYWRFCFWIAMSALLYIALIFALFFGLGMAAGERALHILPFVGLGILAVILGTALYRKSRANGP